MKRQPLNASMHFRIYAVALFLAALIVAPLGADTMQRETPIVKAVRRVGPAVVNISSEVSPRKRTNPFSDFSLSPFLDEFFKDFFEPYQQRRPERTTLGSGVIIDGKRGLILTNAHVIANAGTIKVVLQDQREFEAEVVGADPDFDLSVLRIQSPKSLPTVEMGSSDDLMIGETVIAIGNPFGFSHTVTTGVISALNRSIRTDDRVYHEFIQIDASINPGNSGGPLLNINGELIGINTAIYAKAQGIGFAIPISKARKIISDLIAHGQVIEAWVGLIVQNINRGLARYLGLPETGGVIVKAVETDSPAQRAGIRQGDVIVSVAGRHMFSDSDYQSAMRGIAVGRKIDIDIWRDGDLRTVTIAASRVPDHLGRRLAKHLLGIRVEDLTPDDRRRYGGETVSGVLISDIRPDSHLYRIGARSGDLIRRLNELPIRNGEDFERAVTRYRHKNSIILLLQRGDQAYYITVEI